MTASPTHVDGLLADDLEVFTAVLARHGRDETLQADIELLVEARFTAELLAAYDTHFGGSPDFTPRSLVRLHEDGITPDLAGAALARGHLTANDAIADVRPFAEEGLRKGLDSSQVRKAYTSGLEMAAFERHPVDAILEALALHDAVGGNTNELLALRQLLPRDVYPAHVVSAFLEQAGAGPDAPTLGEVCAALEPHASELTGDRTQTLMLVADPKVREAGNRHGVPFSRLVALGMEGPFTVFDSIERALQVAGGLPEEDSISVIVQLSAILGGATHRVSIHEDLRKPLWIDGPAIPYPELDEALRRYRSLPRLTPAARLSVLPLIGTPGAVAALEAIMAHDGGPHANFAFDNSARVASLASDCSPETASLSATFAANLLATVSPEIAAKAQTGTLRGRSPEALLGVLLQYVIRHGPEATARHLELLTERFALVPDQAIFALVGAQEESVSVEQICAFLDGCPQVSPQVVAKLAARSVDPTLYQAVMRAAPFESVAIHSQIYTAIVESGVSAADAAARLRQVTDGNPLAPRAALLAAAYGRAELLNGPWGAADLTEALLDCDPDMRELPSAHWGLPPTPSLAWPDPEVVPLGVGPRQWTMVVAATEPWSLSTSTAAHQAAAGNVEEWRRTLFPDRPAGTPSAEQVAELRRNAYDYRANMRAAVTDPSLTENDPRWSALHREMLEQELAKDAPDFRMVQSLIRPDLVSNYGPQVASRSDAELLAAFSLLYPELSPSQAIKLMAAANAITVLLGHAGCLLSSVEYDRGPFTDFFEKERLPQGTKFDAKYIYDFAGAYPNAGALRLIVNFVSGQPPYKMPRNLQRVDRKPEALDWFLRNAVLIGPDGLRHSVRDFLGAALPLPEAGPLERKGEEMPRVPANASLLRMLAPEGARAALALDGADAPQADARPPAHPEDSIGAYSQRIGTVVDWYAGILIDPLWVTENAPALIDRRSEAFAPVESVLVRLQDHPLMQGSLDLRALEAIGSQRAPADFVELTYQLELAMKSAWDKAVEEGRDYLPEAAAPNAAAKLKADKARLEALTLEVEIGELHERAQKLTSFSLETEEGRASHRKAEELLQRATELARERDAAAAEAEDAAAEAERLARDTEAIERLLEGISRAPILASVSGGAGLPSLAALAGRNARELPSPAKVQVSAGIPSSTKESFHSSR